MYKRHMILPDDFTVVLQPPSQWVTGLAKEGSGAGPAPKARKARGKAAAKPAAGGTASPIGSYGRATQRPVLRSGMGGRESVLRSGTGYGGREWY